MKKIDGVEDVCHIMNEGEILNKSHPEYPLYNAVFYGDKISTTKFSKRVSCSVKHLPLRLQFSFEYDTLKAIEAGVTINPTLLLDGKVFIEGLVQAEEIEKALKIKIKAKEFIQEYKKRK